MFVAWGDDSQLKFNICGGRLDNGLAPSTQSRRQGGIMTKWQGYLHGPKAKTSAVELLLDQLYLMKKFQKNKAMEAVIADSQSGC